MPEWICAECGCRYYGWGDGDEPCSICGGKIVAITSDKEETRDDRNEAGVREDEERP